MTKGKRCKVCGTVFEPRTPLQMVCGWQCAAAYSAKLAEDREKKDAQRKRKELKEAKERIKTRQEWLKEAQQAVNAWIRERDKDEPCISCQRHHTGQYHAGHYRTTKAAPELRFNELNIHKQCSVCNNHMSGNILEYRINLIKKIGIELVEYLEGAHSAKHYSIEDLKQIKSAYKKKLKVLQNNSTTSDSN